MSQFQKELPQLYHECDMGSSLLFQLKHYGLIQQINILILAAGKPILINYEGWQKSEILNENVGYVLIKISDKAVANFISYTKIPSHVI